MRDPDDENLKWHQHFSCNIPAVPPLLKRHRRRMGTEKRRFLARLRSLRTPRTERKAGNCGRAHRIGVTSPQYNVDSSCLSLCSVDMQKSIIGLAS